MVLDGSIVVLDGSIMVSHGQSWSVMHGHGQSWSVMHGHGLRIHDRVGHGAKDIGFSNYRALKFFKKCFKIVFSESGYIPL